MRHLSPSILAADTMNLGRQISDAEAAGTDHLHIDVMDGVFVPSLSFGMPVVEGIRKGCSLFLDVHLMIIEPERYIKTFAELGADMITFHYEAVKDPETAIDMIRGAGKKAGMAFKPDTPTEAVTEFLPKLDNILCMTVEPGFGGQTIIEHTLDKVSELRGVIDSKGYDCDVQVDGGITLGNVAGVLEKGANNIVAGSAVFRGDVKANVSAFLRIMNGE